MAKATLHSLTKSEQALLAQTERQHLATLDEDQLGDLLVRVRRIRDRHTKLHRQRARERVAEEAARGVVSAGQSRDASKAELFEGALARVSTALARAARQSAAELKAERLAAARDARPVAASSPSPAKATKPVAPKRARQPAPIDRKVAAHTRASGARRQATRDAR